MNIHLARQSWGGDKWNSFADGREGCPTSLEIRKRCYCRILRYIRADGLRGVYISTSVALVCREASNDRNTLTTHLLSCPPTPQNGRRKSDIRRDCAGFPCSFPWLLPTHYRSMTQVLVRKIHYFPSLVSTNSRDNGTIVRKMPVKIHRFCPSLAGPVLLLYVRDPQKYGSAQTECNEGNTFATVATLPRGCRDLQPRSTTKHPENTSARAHAHTLSIYVRENAIKLSQGNMAADRRPPLPPQLPPHTSSANHIISSRVNLLRIIHKKIK